VKKLLLVDDDTNIRFVVQICFEGSPDWNLIEATNGQEALDIAEKELPDLILLDMMMPGMDGVTTLGHLRQNQITATIPVIFMTAKVQTHELESYKHLGVEGVITKPFDPMTLPDEIKEILSKKVSTS
jgi:CheY-like chemotaxis protein